MKYEEAQDKLLDYLYGELDATERRSLEESLAQSPALAKELAAMQQVHQAYQSLPLAPMPSSVHARVMHEAARAAAERAALGAAAARPEPKESAAGWVQRLMSTLMQPAFATAMAAVVVAGVGLFAIRKGVVENDSKPLPSQQLPMGEPVAARPEREASVAHLEAIDRPLGDAEATLGRRQADPSTAAAPATVELVNADKNRAADGRAALEEKPTTAAVVTAEDQRAPTQGAEAMQQLRDTLGVEGNESDKRNGLMGGSLGARGDGAGGGGSGGIGGIGGMGSASGLSAGSVSGKGAGASGAMAKAKAAPPPPPEERASMAQEVARDRGGLNSLEDALDTGKLDIAEAPKPSKKVALSADNEKRGPGSAGGATRSPVGEAETAGGENEEATSAASGSPEGAKRELALGNKDTRPEQEAAAKTSTSKPAAAARPSAGDDFGAPLAQTDAPFANPASPPASAPVQAQAAAERRAPAAAGSSTEGSGAAEDEAQGQFDGAALEASGDALFAQGRYAQAAAAYRQALNKGGASGKARLKLAKALLQSGDMAGAERELRDLDTKSRKSAEGRALEAAIDGQKNQKAPAYDFDDTEIAPVDRARAAEPEPAPGTHPSKK
jgi:tetratricopeptide (TPR) repeat protein